MEIEEIHNLNFPTVPNRQYEPNDTAKNSTIQTKLKKFRNEPDKFDDLFESTYNHTKVEKQVTVQLSPKELIRINRYKNKRIAHLPTYLLKLNLHSIEQEKEVSTSQVPDVAHTKETKVSSSSQVEKVLTNKNLDAIWQ